MDFAELCDQAWETSVDVAADCVEVFARAKASGCDEEPESDPCMPPKRKGDFLYDLIHLNVGYWMQMARLGSAYSIYAHRAVGALYGLYATPRGRSRGNELVYFGVPGDTQTRVLRMTNTSDKDAAPTVEPSPLRSDGYETTVKCALAPDATIAPGRAAKVGIRITIPDEPPGTYRGSLKVELGGRKKAFRLVVRISNA